ncbi:hypothetical protein [Streptomyces sp. NPDC058295]
MKQMLKRLLKQPTKLLLKQPLKPSLKPLLKQPSVRLSARWRNSSSPAI